MQSEVGSLQCVTLQLPDASGSEVLTAQHIANFLRSNWTRLSHNPSEDESLKLSIATKMSSHVQHDFKIFQAGFLLHIVTSCFIFRDMVRPLSLLGETCGLGCVEKPQTGHRWDRSLSVQWRDELTVTLPGASGKCLRQKNTKWHIPPKGVEELNVEDGGIWRNGIDEWRRPEVSCFTFANPMDRLETLRRH